MSEGIGNQSPDRSATPHGARTSTAFIAGLMRIEEWNGPLLLAEHYPLHRPAAPSPAAIDLAQPQLSGEALPELESIF